MQLALGDLKLNFFLMALSSILLLGKSCPAEILSVITPFQDSTALTIFRLTSSFCFGQFLVVVLHYQTNRRLLYSFNKIQISIG
jgi:hypothetical protein